ncbi:MAG: hypothetical protein AB7O04_05010 [Hyphomonadaceae bacterium]
MGGLAFLNAQASEGDAAWAFVALLGAAGLAACLIGAALFWIRGMIRAFPDLDFSCGYDAAHGAVAGPRLYQPD